MLDEKKMSTKLADNSIITKDINITTGSSQYDGFYYGDGTMDLTDADVQLVSVNVITSAVNSPGGATNVFAYVQRIYGDTLRLWTVRANVKCLVRIAYKLGGSN